MHDQYSNHNEYCTLEKVIDGHVFVARFHSIQTWTTAFLRLDKCPQVVQKRADAPL